MGRLFEEARIGTLALKNRIVFGPMGTAYCSAGEPTEQFLAFYRLRARGGAALAVIGAIQIDPVRVEQTDTCLSLADDRFIPALRKLSAVIHEGDCKTLAQLMHRGRYVHSSQYGGQRAVAPSALPCNTTGETPRELETEEVRALVSCFAQAAGRARAAGFDGVELCTNSGYLIGQFLSPVTNHRTDAYGGDLQGRMRFLQEIVTAVRGQVGEKFPICVRMGGNDFIPGGLTNAELCLVAQAAERAGADVISVTGGWHECHVPQITMDVPPACYSYLGRAIRAAVQIPVMMSNRMDIQAGEEMIERGDVDFLVMTRPIIADPDLPNKAREGNAHLICPCVACVQGCLDHVMRDKPVTCLANPLAGDEGGLLRGGFTRPEEIKATAPERILVIGAGAAGLEFAHVAAARGHKVTIWEKAHTPGGQIALAAAPPGRQSFLLLQDYLQHMCAATGVTMVCGKAATAENVCQAVRCDEFDRVVIATGARPIVPRIPVEEGAHVVQAWDVLRGSATLGENVVVIGGGAVGVETGLFAAEIGTMNAETLRFLMIHEAEPAENLLLHLNTGSKKVTIVEMQKAFGADIGITTRWVLLKRLRQLSVTLRSETKVLEIRKAGVLAEYQGTEHLIQSDTAVLAVGSESESLLYGQLQGQVKKLDLIGDAREPRKMQQAVRDAYLLAISV